MGLRLVQANFKARDDEALGRFWAAAFGWNAKTVTGGGATSITPDGFDWRDPAAPVCVDVIAVPDPATVHYRTHLELAARPGLIERLQGLGATRLSETLLTDPEGNAFCVTEPQTPDSGPIAAVVVDCADPRSLARFWADALAWTVHEQTGDHVVLRSVQAAGPSLRFSGTPHTAPLPTRAHLDVVGADQAAEVARVLGLGATLADVGQGPDVSWEVLADPEGNEFCILRG